MGFTKEQLDGMVFDALDVGFSNDLCCHILALVAEVEKLQAAYIQAAAAFENGRNYMRCLICNRWFDRLDGKSRSTRKACSAACRQALHRQKTNAAKEQP